MNGPTMFDPRPVAADTTCLPAYLPIPGYGVLPVNSFVIAGAEPILVDTGLAALGGPFMTALEKAIDPTELCWIWISHTDADHLGNLDAVLARAPNARVVTNFVGMAKMMLLGRDVSRVHMLEPGRSVEAGDRTLVPFRPPVYDAPETMGFVDSRTRVLFSADAFGALLPNAVESAAAVPAAELRAGMGAWAAIDAPWLGHVNRDSFAKNLSRIERLGAAAIISGHLPQATGLTATLLRNLMDAQAAGPTDAPDHELLDRLVAESTSLASQTVA